MGQHRRDIESNKTETEMQAHMNNAHGLRVMPKVKILETLEPETSDKDRRNAEFEWSKRLCTFVPWGGNIQVLGHGNVDRITDPLTKRNIPYFTCKFERVLPRGPKKKRTSKMKERRINNTETAERAIEIFESLEYNHVKKYRYLATLKKSELEKLTEEAAIPAGPKRYFAYQQIASYMLSRLPNLEHKPKLNKPRIQTHHTGLASTIITPERTLQLSRMLTKAERKSVIFCRTLPRTLGSLALNYSQFLKELSTPDIANYIEGDCECSNTGYADDALGHVMTGNIAYVSNDSELGKLLGKGTKYRPHTRSDINEAAFAAITAVQSFLHQRLKNGKLTKEECSATYRNCHLSIEELRQRARDVLDEQNYNHTTNRDRKAVQRLKDLQKDHVIVPVDKATANFAFICKHMYTRTLCTELGVTKTTNGNYKATGNGTYTPVDSALVEIVNKHKELTLRFVGESITEENERIPLLWCSAKMHKNPKAFRFIAGAAKSSGKQLAVRLSNILSMIQQHWKRYMKVAEERSGLNFCWSIKNSAEVVHLLQSSKAGTSINSAIADFSTLFTALEHQDIFFHIDAVLDRLFKHSGHKYISVGRTAYFHSDNNRKAMKYRIEDVKEMLRAVISNSYVTFAGMIFRQTKGIPMGSNASSVVTDLTLSHMEYQFLSKRENRKDAIRLKNTVRYIDDIASFWTSALREVHQKIYPPSLPLNFDDTSSGVLHFLDLDIDLKTNGISVFDKRREFDFEVLRVPEKSSNQPPTVGLNCFYSQIVRIARITNTKDELSFNLRLLINTMRIRGYKKDDLYITLKKVILNYRLLFHRSGIRRPKSILAWVNEEYTNE